MKMLNQINYAKFQNKKLDEVIDSFAEEGAKPFEG